MKPRYFKSCITVLSVAFIMGVTSCISDLNISPIDPSVNPEFSQDEVFAKIYATLALTGQEGPAGQGDVAGIDEGFSAFYRLIFTMNEYPTDEALCHWTDDGVPEMYQMNWGSSHGQIEGLYGRLNFDVAMCNHFLEKTDGMEDEKTVRQRAEARFIRALNYYFLMDMFGNPPFTETVTDVLPPQIARKDLFDYIEKELKEIEADMYEARQAPFGRADKVATWFLLSRMYLNAQVYTGTARWSDAADYAKKVIDSSYELCPDYKLLFMGDNDENPLAMQEMILPIRQDGEKIRSYGGSLFLIAATHNEGMNSWGTSEGWGGVRARKTFVDKFFPNNDAPLNADETEIPGIAGDDRAMFFSKGERTVENESVSKFLHGFSVAKWTNTRSDGRAPHDAKYTDTDIPFFRLGEAYLTYAEAILRSGGPEQTALDAVNTIRDRANATRLATLNLDMILDERSRELYYEAVRRTDLVRYGYFTSNKYLWEWKGGQPQGTAVNSNLNVYPIPVNDIIVNENLVQNPGY